MAGMKPTPEAQYGDLTKMAQMGFKNNPAEDLPRFVDRRGAAKPGGGLKLPKRMQTPRGRRPLIPRGHNQLAVAAAIAARNLRIAQAAARDPSGGNDPEVMNLLRRAEAEYTRAFMAWKMGTPDFDEPTPGLPGEP